METQSHRYEVKAVDENSITWFVEVASINMLQNELCRPELICIPTLYSLANRGMESGTAFVVYLNDKPVGAIGALIVPNLFNPLITTLAEVFWYILPEARNTRAGFLLLKRLEERAKEVADELTLSLLAAGDVNIDTLEKRGFYFEELGFRKKL